MIKLLTEFSTSKLEHKVFQNCQSSETLTLFWGTLEALCDFARKIRCHTFQHDKI
eukprot:UN13853